jgi:hypothetical protein
VEHDVAGSRELIGSDVILAHRLLKNTVTETHRLRGYALVTDACADILGLSGRRLPHVERYDDVGEVSCGLVDLSARWRAEEATGRNVVAREDAALLFEADIGAPPQHVWTAMTDPAHGMRWRVGVDDIQEQNPDALVHGPRSRAKPYSPPSWRCSASTSPTYCSVEGASPSWSTDDSPW